MAGDRKSDPRFYEFCLAAEHDLEAAARLVAEDPSIVEARNSTGETAFHYLVVEDELDAVRWLLEHGSDINSADSFGATPLMEAAQLGYVEMCRFLLDRGADPRIRDSEGDAALAYALTSALLPTEDGPDRASIERAAGILIAEVTPEEDINDYFSPMAAEWALDDAWPWSERLKRMGLEPERCRY